MQLNGSAICAALRPCEPVGSSRTLPLEATEMMIVIASTASIALQPLLA